MLKKFFVFLLLVAFFFFPKKVSAQGEFITDIDVEYTVFESGITRVTHKISLENVLSTLYATSYNLTLENINPENPKALYQEKPLGVNLRKKGNINELEVKFEDSIVGKGKKRYFEISYESSGFAQRTGEVWEISIPRLSSNSNFRTYNLTLLVPASFGEEAYLSPKARESFLAEGEKVYKFDRESVSQMGITAGFGAFQVFAFSLEYHLENPLTRNSFSEIAIPPDTNMQKVYYQTIEPKPEKVSIDLDGNWLAGYTLKPRQRLDVKAIGFVQIFSGPRPFPKPSSQLLQTYLKPSEFWQTEDYAIKELASKLKTPREIYDYVIKNLSYSYETVLPTSKRKGAVLALNEPKSSLCTEYTDLFIAIARAGGIPAREVNGYAYTENPKIQPLSLVNDVLHSWPEYWDFTKNEWIQVDPTWASTTGGMDFFTKLDLRHFTFVTHGQDPQKPLTPGSYKLGPNPQKDVFVNFGKLPEKRVSGVKLFSNLVRNLPFSSVKYEIVLENEGPTALYNLKTLVTFESKVREEKDIEALAPFAKTRFEVTIPYSLLGRNTPANVIVYVHNSQISLKTFKNRIITDSLFIVFILTSCIAILVLIKAKPFLIIKTYNKIKSLIGKSMKNVR